jgi:hypothetical protein
MARRRLNADARGRDGISIAALRKNACFCGFSCRIRDRISGPAACRRSDSSTGFSTVRGHSTASDSRLVREEKVCLARIILARREASDVSP